jgi:pimeloyl-ACP methyl ester carboxylesterase
MVVPCTVIACGRRDATGGANPIFDFIASVTYALVSGETWPSQSIYIGWIGRIARYVGIAPVPGTACGLGMMPLGVWALGGENALQPISVHLFGWLEAGALSMKRRILSIAKTALVAVTVLTVLATVSGLGFRAYRQHLSARVLAIQSPNGVQEEMYVKIGGIDQWIQIRGEDRGNPVILFVHGGPGASSIPISSGWQPWEKFFTVVQWDQRGAGRTFRMSGESVAATMTLAQMTQDGVELVEYLRAHLHKDRIVLIGHSWGSFLGIHFVKQRPDLFLAFVGTGQVVGRQTFEKQFDLVVARLKALAQAANNGQALEELASISPAPGYAMTKRDIVQKWAKLLSLPPIEAFQLVSPIPPVFVPDFSLLDWYYWQRGMSFSAAQLTGGNGPMIRSDLGSLGTEFSIPMFFFEGTEDIVTPIEPAYAYFEQIKAPRKEFVRFEGGDHFIPFDRPDEFLERLMEHIRPLVFSLKSTN